MNDEQPATPQSAEPEVWRYMRPGGEWFYTNYHDPDDPDCENGQPLYAATPQQPAAASAGASDERAAFEAAMRARGIMSGTLQRSGDDYTFVSIAWSAWQARAALQSPPVATAQQSEAPK